MTKAVADVLRAARAKIATPERWTQDSYARSKYGYPIASEAAQAVCWCGFGAIRAVTQDDDLRQLAFDTLHGLTRNHSFPDWQDGLSHTKRGHAAVLRAFDRAIAAEDAQP